MSKALRGVNLGGWLVLERWITPSLFAGTNARDEHQLGQVKGSVAMRKLLHRHRQHFITEQDVKWISEAGFDVIRLPVGYWLFEDTDGFFEFKSYVDDLFVWASRYDLRVILDLHAVPGSQNGWDHSGKTGAITWHKDDENIINTLVVIRQIAQAYGSHEALYGIELINEPHWDIPLKILLDYYEEGHNAVRELCGRNVKVIVSDSFRANEMASGLQQMGRIDVIMDSHLYQVFTEQDKRLSFTGHMNKVEEWKNELKRVGGLVPVMVGEWSAALDPSTFKSADQDAIDGMTNDYFMKQRDVFDSCVSIWTYWTYKTEDKGAWSFKDQQGLRLN